jgi:cell division protein FtsB
MGALSEEPGLRARAVGTPVVAVLLLVALAGVLTYVLPFRQIIAQRRAVELSERKRAVLREENVRLEAEAAALQTPTEVERIAREDYGLVRPGEVAYVVVTPRAPAGETVGTPAARSEEGRAPPAWATTIWDFLTGRDLVP